MNVNLVDLLIALVPSIITAIISYVGATKKSESEIFAVKEATKRNLESIRADTDREIEKIKADTNREIEKIQAQTDSQIKIMEAESKSKESDKINEMMFGALNPILSDPKNWDKLLELGKEPTEKEVVELFRNI